MVGGNEGVRGRSGGWEGSGALSAVKGLVLQAVGKEGCPLQGHSWSIAVGPRRSEAGSDADLVGSHDLRHAPSPQRASVSFLRILDFSDFRASQSS